MDVTAKITSKGQITIPRAVRRDLGVGEGDDLKFERTENGYEIIPKRKGSAFAKYRGIGTPGIGPGRDAVINFIREMRGHDIDE